MKGFSLFVVFFLIISCSDSDKFSGEKNYPIRIEGFYYEVDKSGKVELYAGLQSEKNCFSGICTTFRDCYWVINNKCCISSKNLSACHISDYLWIIDNDTIPSFENPYDAGYGEHFVKLVLVDTFGDSISDSTYIQVDEPLKITLLSPVEEYKALKTDRLVFQYHISGIDIWEETAWQDTVYISTDENVLENKALLWEKGRALRNKFLNPPLNEPVYYWGVKVYNQEQDTTIYSEEIRSVWVN